MLDRTNFTGGVTSYSSGSIFYIYSPEGTGIWTFLQAKDNAGGYTNFYCYGVGGINTIHANWINNVHTYNWGGAQASGSVTLLFRDVCFVGDTTERGMFEDTSTGTFVVENCFFDQYPTFAFPAGRISTSGVQITVTSWPLLFDAPPCPIPPPTASLAEHRSPTAPVTATPMATHTACTATISGEALTTNLSWVLPWCIRIEETSFTDVAGRSDGGAVSIVNTTTVAVVGCQFCKCSTGPSGQRHGGALYVSGATEIGLVRTCGFLCTGAYRGGFAYLTAPVVTCDQVAVAVATATAGDSCGGFHLWGPVEGMVPTVSHLNASDCVCPLSYEGAAWLFVGESALDLSIFSYCTVLGSLPDVQGGTAINMRGLYNPTIESSNFVQYEGNSYQYGVVGAFAGFASQTLWLRNCVFRINNPGKVCDWAYTPGQFGFVGCTFAAEVQVQAGYEGRLRTMSN